MKVTIEPTSTVITRVVYEGGTSEGWLTITFRSGAVYEYRGVDFCEFETLFGADEPSVGEWFNDHIRPIYDGERLESVAN